MVFYKSSGSSHSYSFGPNYLKTGILKSGYFVFQMVCKKLEAIYPDFEWSGFWISDPIQNLDHLQVKLFLPFETSLDLKLGHVRISDPHCINVCPVSTGGSNGALWVLELFFDCLGLIRVWAAYKGILGL